MKNQPVKITFRDAVGFDADITVGDLVVTPGPMPIAGVDVKMRVGDVPEVTFYGHLHDGWSVDMLEARVKFLELVERTEVQDMRTSPARADLRRAATDIMGIVDELARTRVDDLAPKDGGIGDRLTVLAKWVDEIGGRL